ncbi:MAG TPA: SprT-like domain-containing protein [Edaphocola sp.]|nr:SprT-like domain-containing protein [Edaphocola sp.]
MAKEKLSFEAFGAYLPNKALVLVVPWFEEYNINLLITKARQSKLGDYLHPHPARPFHSISISSNQNKYSFLITLLHEFAHLKAYVIYKNKIQPHGVEWQNIYREILKEYVGCGIFPDSLEAAIINSLDKLKASSCADKTLYKALAAFDAPLPDHIKWVEELPIGSFFQFKDGNTYKIIQKKRTRFLCEQIHTKRQYLFQGVAKVKPLEI